MEAGRPVSREGFLERGAAVLELQSEVGGARSQQSSAPLALTRTAPHHTSGSSGDPKARQTPVF